LVIKHCVCDVLREHYLFMAYIFLLAFRREYMKKSSYAGTDISNLTTFNFFMVNVRMSTLLLT